jgi:hypothetical protein
METIFSTIVAINKNNESANTESVLALSKDVSPVKRCTICTVIVVEGLSGLKLMVAIIPQVKSTIIVSPNTLEITIIRVLTISGKDIGIMSFFTVSNFVKPIAVEASFKVFGMAEKASSNKVEA